MINYSQELETKRLILKTPREEHLKDYQKYFNNYEIIRHLSSKVPWPFPDDGVESFFKENIYPALDNNEWFWGIFLKTDKEHLIGGVHLREGTASTKILGNRGFWLGEPFWGNGYMTEACSAVNNFAFNELDLKELIFANAVGNQRSRRIKEKTGAKYFKTEPFEFVDPKLKEHEFWKLTKENWLGFKKNNTSTTN